MTKTMSKVEQAKTIIADNPNSTRSELIKMFMEQIGMSKAGASTYAFNLAKNAPKAVRTKKMAEAIVHAAAKTIAEVEEVVQEVVPEVETVVLDKAALKRARDAARKREKRAAEKAAKQAA